MCRRGARREHGKCGSHGVLESPFALRRDHLHTLEVFGRGFLLGFGATLLKDLLIDGKREASDRANAVHYGKSIGLGMGCVLVGLSVLVPTRLQEWVMESNRPMRVCKY